MVFICDTCHYVFANEKLVEQCPDCGKFNVRAATAEEERDYLECKEKIQSW